MITEANKLAFIRNQQNDRFVILSYEVACL